MATDLATLLNRIPIAEDGIIIGRHFHNSTRDFLQALVGQVGAGPGTQGGTFSFAPIFVYTEGALGTNWKQPLGFASKPDPPAGVNPPVSSADGWLALQLPDGTRIQRLVVIGQITGTVL